MRFRRKSSEEQGKESLGRRRTLSGVGSARSLYGGVDTHKSAGQGRARSGRRDQSGFGNVLASQRALLTLWWNLEVPGEGGTR